MLPLAGQGPWQSSVYPPIYQPRDWRNGRVVVHVYVDVWLYHDPNVAYGPRENGAQWCLPLSLSPGRSIECSGYYTVGIHAEFCFAHYSSGRAEYARLNDMSEAYRNDHTSLQIHTRDREYNLPHHAGSSR